MWFNKELPLEHGSSILNFIFDFIYYIRINNLEKEGILRA
jgi:hypothetical protein